MTEQDDTQVPEREIDFRGRKIWVKMPRPEQLLVWQRTVKRLQGADVDGWNGEQMLAALERGRSIIDSVLLHPVDVDWLDDEMLAGNILFPETAKLIELTVLAFAPEENRADRRATKTTPPAKKAARKKAAPAR